MMKVTTVMLLHNILILGSFAKSLEQSKYSFVYYVYKNLEAAHIVFC